MRLLSTVALAACALVLAGSTGATSTKGYRLKVNDTFFIAGTDLGCEAIVGKKLLVGRKLIACYKLKNSAPAPKSYAAALASDGEVAVARAERDGSGAIVFRRRPAELGMAARRLTVRVGDQLLFEGTDLGCAISTGASTGAYTSCFRLGKNGGRPNSYGFAQTSSMTTVVQFDASGRRSKAVYSKKHGR